MDKPYFAQDRPSGTRLETAPDPPHGIKYVKVSTWQLICKGKEVAANRDSLQNYPPAPRSLWTVLQPRQLILSLVKR